MHRAILFLLVLAVGNVSCDSTVEPVEFAVQSTEGSQITILFNGESYEFSYLVEVRQDQEDIHIRGFNSESRGVAIDLFRVDGPGVYFISPFIARRANIQFYFTRDDVYLVRQASSQILTVTDMTSSEIAGTFRVAAFKPGGDATIIEGHFRCSLL